MMNRISKFWMKMRSVVVEFSLCIRLQCGLAQGRTWEHTHPSRCSGLSRPPWLFVAYDLGTQRTCLLIRLFPLSLTTATSVPSVPWATGSTPSLHLCSSYHPQTATLPWSLSNDPNTLHSPVSVSSDSVLLWNADPLSILRDSPLLLHISLYYSPTRLHAPEEHVIFSSIFQNTIILGFQ